MIDVNGLNNSIEELEKQSAKIKTISEIYDKLEGLAGQIEVNKDLQKKSVDEIQNTSKQLLQFTSEYKQYLDEVKDTNQSLLDNYKTFENDFLKQMQALSSANSKFYLEFQEIVASKLDRAKSDIEVEMRNLQNQIKKTIDDDVLDKISNLESEINSITQEQKKKDKNQNIFLMVILIITLINLVVHFIKF